MPPDVSAKRQRTATAKRSPGTAAATTLPIEPPFPVMEALSAAELPQGAEWQYEPKWDGFRCLVFRDGADVKLQSKGGQPLARYFPELVEFFVNSKPQRFVIDGEIVI